MAVLRRAPATLVDLAALPDHVVGELVAGELYVSPRPARPHASASSRLGAIIVPPFDFGANGPGGWMILDEPEMHVGQDVVVPDIAGWRAERIASTPFDVTYFTVTPDWLCEVLSPSTARLDRSVKLKVYARERIPHVWILDPLAQTLESYVLDGATYALARVESEGARVRIDPFAAIEMDLALLWAK